MVATQRMQPQLGDGLDSRGSLRELNVLIAERSATLHEPARLRVQNVFASSCSTTEPGRVADIENHRSPMGTTV